MKWLRAKVSHVWKTYSLDAHKHRQRNYRFNEANRGKNECRSDSLECRQQHARRTLFDATRKTEILDPLGTSKMELSCKRPLYSRCCVFSVKWWICSASIYVFSLLIFSLDWILLFLLFIQRLYLFMFRNYMFVNSN